MVILHLCFSCNILSCKYFCFHTNRAVFLETCLVYIEWGLPWCLRGKESTCQYRRCGFSSSRRSPREGNCNPLQYSCLGNPIDRGAWRAAVHGVTKELDTTEQLNNNNTAYIGHNTVCFAHSLSDEHLGCFWFSAYFRKHSWILIWCHVSGSFLSAMDLAVNKIKSFLYTFKRIQTIKEDTHISKYHAVVSCSLLGYSPRGCKESDTTWQLSMHTRVLDFGILRDNVVVSHCCFNLNIPLQGNPASPS